jgi:hypothetical protein
MVKAEAVSSVDIPRRAKVRGKVAQPTAPVTPKARVKVGNHGRNKVDRNTLPEVSNPLGESVFWMQESSTPMTGNGLKTGLKPGNVSEL